MSPKYFEKQLPYAVALELEKTWSETFDQWLSSAEAISKGISDYDPTWDNDRWFSRPGRRSTGGGFNDFSSTMSKSFSAAMPTPKSSSGSSGGFSGGGGGGGGGGGW